METYLYIAKDSDGSVCIFRTQPVYNSEGDWVPPGDEHEFIECGPIGWPEIEPATCHRLETKIKYTEAIVCPFCKGTGSVLVDIDHRQWLRCSCSHGDTE